VNTVLTLRAQVGAKVNRLDTLLSRQASTKVNLAQLRSSVEDVDFAEATTDLATRQTAFQASLAAGARIIQPSLLDYLT